MVKDGDWICPVCKKSVCFKTKKPEKKNTDDYNYHEIINDIWTELEQEKKHKQSQGSSRGEICIVKFLSTH